MHGTKGMSMAQAASGFLPAYLVVGEDQLKRRTVITRLRRRIAQLGEALDGV